MDIVVSSELAQIEVDKLVQEASNIFGNSVLDASAGGTVRLNAIINMNVEVVKAIVKMGNQANVVSTIISKIAYELGQVELHDGEAYKKLRARILSSWYTTYLKTHPPSCETSRSERQQEARDFVGVLSKKITNKMYSKCSTHACCYDL